MKLVLSSTYIEESKKTIHAVSMRCLDKFLSNIFISYFSYFKTIVSFSEHNDIIKRTKSQSIVKINDDNDANNENNVKNQVH